MPQEGDSRKVFGQILPKIYDELKSLARIHSRAHRRDKVLQTTALVHEIYIRLADRDEARWEDERHLKAVVSKAMRHVLIDQARRELAQKRRMPEHLHEAGPHGNPSREHSLRPDLLSLDRALNRLAEHSRRLAEVVECRFFGGLTVEETAQALKVSTRTVERDWIKAKSYLRRSLSGGSGS